MSDDDLPRDDRSDDPHGEGPETRPGGEVGTDPSDPSDPSDTTGDDGGRGRSSLVGRISRGLPSVELRRDRVGLWIVTFLLLAALSYVAWRYVGTLVLGVFAYYVARPVFDRIQTRVGSRTLAVVVTLLSVALPVLFLVGWTVALLLDSLSRVLGTELGDQIAELIQPYVDLTALAAEVTVFARSVLEDPSRLADLRLGAGLSELVDVVLGALGGLFNVGLHGFIVVIVVFYLLRDDYRIAGWARNTFVPPDGVLERYFLAVDADLKNVYFGNILNALLTSFLAVFTYLLLNAVAPPTVRIPEPVFVGLLVGGASLVPVIGIKLVTWPVALYLFVRTLLVAPEALWFPVLFLLVSFVVVDYIPDQLLRPYVSGRTLHVGAVMLAYTFGPLLFGWYGIFLGPLILVVVFEFARIVFPWLIDPENVGAGGAAVGDSEPPPSPEAVETPALDDTDLPPDTGGEPGGPSRVGGGGSTDE